MYQFFDHLSAQGAIRTWSSWATRLPTGRRQVMAQS